MDDKKIVSNLIWRFGERLGAKLVSVIVSVVLARILSPEDYGLVALVAVIITVLQVFVDSGLGNALIQKKNADDVDFSTVFYTNIFVSVFLYILLFCFSPYIAYFFNNIELIQYIRVLGITILIAGVKNVQQAYVSRNMIFRNFFFATLSGTIIAGIVGIYMAINGAGVWALIAQHIVNLFIDTVMLWFIVRWRPIRAFSINRLQGLFSYGWKLLVSALINTLFNNGRQFIIGKIYTTSELAYYNKGEQFPNLIVTNINVALDSVLLPTMSKEQDNKDSIRTLTRNTIRISIYVIAPIMIGLAFAGKSVIGLVLTEKWFPALLFMQIFCIDFMFYPINTANLSALQAMGRSDLFLKLEIKKKCVLMMGLLATMYISVEAMAYSIIVTSFICQMINAKPNKILINYGYMEQLKDILPSILLAIGMGIFILPVQYLNFSYGLTLLLQIILGGGVYIAGSWIFKPYAFNYILNTVKKIKNWK